MQSRLPLSVAVITLNEEKHLARCLASVRELAAEIVVVDSGSTDGTEKVAREFGAKFSVQPWQGHVAQKNLALAACSQPWVLSLDGDEAVSPELAVALRELFSGQPPAADGYEINRRTFYLGEWVNHSWNPEWRQRLVRREKAQWQGPDPHDRLEVTGGNTARLQGDLLHYSYENLQDHFERTVRYARISADAMERAGKRCRWYHRVFSPWRVLCKRLLLKQGFRDGRRGWIIAYTTFFSVLAKYAFLYEKREVTPHAEKPKANPPGGER
ncbi:MAG: glycosyltransferase family 2 protein [Verrucomicrobia bacterium]|nr:glycosyltransferase family 2 protein [Verrucomicrobiota bacterium]